MTSVSGNFLGDRLIERRLRRGTQALRELRDELKVIEEQLDHIEGEAQDIEIRAMIAETPAGALEHHQAQQHLEVIQKYRNRVVASIAEQELRQDKLLDDLGD